MTFRQLRNQLVGRGYTVIRWNNSGIVEAAHVTETGAVVITNMITRRTFKIPHRYADIDVTVLGGDELVALGDLFPKGMRNGSQLRQTKETGGISQ